MKQTYLKSKLHYELKTGIFTYARNVNRFKKGQIAGTIKGTDGYCKIIIDKKQYTAHRLAWLYVHGYLPEGQIDHINHVRADNRIDNLRDVTQSENQRNATKREDNTSGTTGVNWHKRDKRWYARIKVGTKRINLGGFVEYSEAVNARKNAEVLYGYHENHGKDKQCLMK